MKNENLKIIKEKVNKLRKFFEDKFPKLIQERVFICDVCKNDN